MNKVILTGNICKDIQVNESGKGNKVVSNTIAVRREFKNSQGEYDCDFINFVAWNGQAEYLSNYAAKGDKIEICGRMQVRSYENKEGINIYITEVVVESLNILVHNPDKEKELVDELQEVKDGNEDLPF